MMNEEHLPKKALSLEEYSNEPLTDIELKKLRRLLEAEARMEWFWQMTWLWSRALLITVGSIYFIRDWLGEALAALSKVFK